MFHELPSKIALNRHYSVCVRVYVCDLRVVVHANQAHSVHCQDAIAQPQFLALRGRRVGHH